MFDSLQNKLSDAFRSLRGKAKLSEANMREGLDLVQNALLEADVSYPVVQKFIADISAEALGERVIKSLDPTQLVANIVYQKLVELMGPVDHSLHLKAGNELTILMITHNPEAAAFGHSTVYMRDGKVVDRT